jgi:flagellar basal-body rod protein FlgG
MNDALYIAATGMQAQQLNVDTIANNLVNVNTAGFKAGRVSFMDLVYRELGRAAGSAGATEGVAARSMGQGTGVGIASLSKLFVQGDLKKTDVPLDLAIQGNGFFEVTLPDGTQAFTRGGSMQVNHDGFLVSADGYMLKPSVRVGSDFKQIRVGADGKVTVLASGLSTPFEAGGLELTNFASPAGLVALGQNLYKASEASGDPVAAKAGEDGAGTVAQGFVESSNVKMVDEMVNLMVAQRAYEMSVKVIQASDEMLAMSNNLRK